MQTKEISVLPVDSEFEVRLQDSMCVNESKISNTWWSNLQYLIVGLFFGVVLLKAEIISWFRIQEMFRLQSFHMYGVIGSAVIVGALSVWIIKRTGIKTLQGESIVFHPKSFNKGNIIGGFLFGLGWALTGACPGPMFAHLGTGAMIMLVPLVSAIAGTWVYGLIRSKLPH